MEPTFRFRSQVRGHIEGASAKAKENDTASNAGTVNKAKSRANARALLRIDFSIILFKHNKTVRKNFCAYPVVFFLVTIWP